MEVEEDESKIILTYFQGASSIWNTADWRKARRHRIVGTLVGNLAHHPHQVRENGFPVLLTKNETTLLIENNLGTLTNYPSLLQVPRDKIKDEFLNQRQLSFSKQVVLLKERRRTEILEKADSIVKGKLAKRRKMDPGSSWNEEEERESIIQKEISTIADPAEIYLSIQTCTEDPWTRPEDREPVDWAYPSTAADRLEYGTFRALWESGHWVTPGGKFGGTFLAYPGDPLLYHAHLIVHCVARADSLSPLDLVATARLAHSTRKTAVLAYAGDHDDIAFQSLSWVHD